MQSVGLPNLIETKKSNRLELKIEQVMARHFEGANTESIQVLSKKKTNTKAGKNCYHILQICARH